MLSSTWDLGFLLGSEVQIDVTIGRPRVAVSRPVLCPFGRAITHSKERF